MPRAFGPRQRPTSLDIASGKVPGLSSENKFGRAPSVVASIPTDIWDRANTVDNQPIFVAPTQARIHAIASSDDTDAGVLPGGSSSSAGMTDGAHTVRVFGLVSWDLPEVSEDIRLKGTTPVNTVNAYVIVHRVLVLNKGGDGPNVGVITATAAVDNTITAQINAGEGETQMAIYGIPSVQKGFISCYYASLLKQMGGPPSRLDVTFLANPEPNVEMTGFLVKHTRGLLDTGSSEVIHVFDPEYPIPGPAIVKVQVVGIGMNLDVSGGFDVKLENQ